MRDLLGKTSGPPVLRFFGFNLCRKPVCGETRSASGARPADDPADVLFGPHVGCSAARLYQAFAGTGLPSVEVTPPCVAKSTDDRENRDGRVPLVLVLRRDIDIEQSTQARVHDGSVRAVEVVVPAAKSVVQHLGVGFGDENIREGFAHHDEQCHSVDAHGSVQGVGRYDAARHFGIAPSKPVVRGTPTTATSAPARKGVDTEPKGRFDIENRRDHILNSAEGLCRNADDIPVQKRRLGKSMFAVATRIVSDHGAAGRAGGRPRKLSLDGRQP